MDIEYTLEIYAPDSESVVDSRHEGLTTPPATFNVGDKIKTATMEGSATVTRVSHLTWESFGKLNHKVMIFTTRKTVRA